MSEALCDRWAVLTDLTRARRVFGLNDRQIQVLRALVTCLPVKIDHGLVVFASNQKLIDKTLGMPERTLRRHLAHLVEAGLIDRRDSPNKKRYIRRAQGPLPASSYGFDLTPLYAAAGRIAEAAEQVAQEEAYLRFIREKLSLSRRALLEAGCDPDLIEEIRRELRRVPVVTTLEDLLARAEARLSGSDEQPEAEEMADCAGQSVRHYHKRYKDLPETGACGDETSPPRPSHQVETEMLRETKERPALPHADQIAERCPDALSFAPEAPRSWRDLVGLALSLAPMIGIGREVSNLGLQRLGHEGFALATLCLCQMLETVEKPGAYLRSLCVGADPGGAPMRLFARLKPAKSSATVRV
ncbi:MAG: plasmid replication protein RepC [Roseibium sp.]|uniref:plasmid replication protein RepC n=1 Tax=Roseibium sp. TaxID=1936156 RepID=UPI003299900E